jgi:hypothetical protein
MCKCVDNRQKHIKLDNKNKIDYFFIVNITTTSKQFIIKTN